MRAFVTPFSSILGALTPIVWSNPIASSSDSSFSLEDGKAAFTFQYDTSAPDDTNWIGIYPSGKGPKAGYHSEASLIWDYTPDGSGELFLDATALATGNYDVYFLAKGGYSELADRITVTVPTHFLPTRPITLRNGRVGDKYSASVSGLVADNPGKVTFSLSSVDGGDWASISKDGVISGTPDKAGNSTVKVTASGSDSSDDLEMTISVVESGKDLVSSLGVMTFNLWNQGTKVHGYAAKQVAFLAESGVDVVGLQETHSARTKALATALGWDYYNSNGEAGILSKYPITEQYGSLIGGRGVGIRIDIGGKEVNHWNVHLGYTPYGPYDFCFDGLSGDQVLKNEEKSGRTPQIKEIIKKMGSNLDGSDETPVLLTGDFNAPSHLDWTEDNKDAHCGNAFDWPTSKEPIKAGLIDALREIDPDPVTKPHITWSPIFLKNPSYDNKPEPQDRIDFIYYKGKTISPKTVDTVVTGDPKPEPNQADNKWTSDHRAVIVTFDV